MKTIALAIALVLHVTGLWPHISQHARDRLANTATARLDAAPTPSATTATNLALPIRTATPDTITFPQDTSIVAIDRASATTLYAQNPTKSRSIASITKIVTILVILSRHSPDESVTIGNLPTYEPGAALIGLQPGETYRLADLVRAALIPSANDAADALAIYDSGNLTRFAAQMNLKMSAWDIPGTRFTNPSGLQDNYASADALARIALLALQNPFIHDTVSHSSVSLTSTAGRTLTDVSTNQLLATGRYYGIKTGYTLSAGECFLGLTRINGHDVITVILGSSDRFGATEQLVTWIGKNYQWL